MKSLIPLLLATVAAYEPTVYMIRHGEKPEDRSKGLSPEGEQRAECIRGVFGASSQYKIGKIMAQGYHAGGSRKRSYDTVLPLANDLGLEVDTSCDRDDSSCVKEAVKAYNGDGNILICWQHGQMTNIAEELGVDDIGHYPRHRSDIIWTIPYPYEEIIDKTSENCPGLDDKGWLHMKIQI